MVRKLYEWLLTAPDEQLVALQDKLRRLFSYVATEAQSAGDSEIRIIPEKPDEEWTGPVVYY